MKTAIAACIAGGGTGQIPEDTTAAPSTLTILWEAISGYHALAPTRLSTERGGVTLPLLADSLEVCSGRCRAARSRLRKAEARRERDAEIRALLEAALRRLREET